MNARWEFKSLALTGVIACLAVGGCGSDEMARGHVTQLATDSSGPSVSDVRNDSGVLTAIKVGDTQVLLSQEIIGVSGGQGRPIVGSVLHAEDIVVRHVNAHWNQQTNVVAPFAYISYGAWATGTAEPRADQSVLYNWEGIGDAYLTALDEARTSDADMPVSGTATYLGQSTGFVQGHGTNGVRGHFVADVEMTADFTNSEIMVDVLSTLNNRFVLSGMIQDNEFSGTTISEMTDSPPLQAQGATARFRGGFYGDEAIEAGGVFEVIGGRPQDPGRLVGGFGGRKTE